MGILEDIVVAAVNEEPPPPLPNWVEWKHISKGLTHCPVCLSLDQRWFVDENKPILPQHINCHCTAEPIPLSIVLNNAKAECRIIKFKDYIFNPEYAYNGKMALFESWGYDIIDSKMLQIEYKKQALEKYIQGQYELGLLDMYGQRISIEIKLNRKDGTETVLAKSGWMVYPNGKIELTTPMAGGKKR